MKKAITLSVLLIFSILSFAQVRLEGLVKPGTKLIYAVEAGEQKYNFIVTVKTLLPVVTFDWEMTDPISNNGTITHTAAAMMAANTMYNRFSPGSKTLDDNSLSVWLSKNSHAGLTKGNKWIMISMNTGDAPKKMGANMDDLKELKITVNGEKETVEEAIAKVLNEEGRPVGDEDFFTFYNSSKLPIILRMKIDFYIVLKEIKTK